MRIQKTLMYAFDRFEDMDLITELLKGMYAELPEENQEAKFNKQASVC